MTARTTLLVAVALCVACLGAPLVGTSWTLVSLRTGGVTLLPQAFERYTVTLQDSSRASGMVNCNSCGGMYRHSGDSLTVSMMFCTDMACQQSVIEGSYTATIQSGGRYELSGDTLRLYGADTLVFAAPVAGTRVTGLARCARPVLNGRCVVPGSGLLLAADRSRAWYDCRGRRAQAVRSARHSSGGR